MCDVNCYVTLKVTLVILHIVKLLGARSYESLWQLCSWVHFTVQSQFDTVTGERLLFLSIMKPHKLRNYLWAKPSPLRILPEALEFPFSRKRLRIRRITYIHVHSFLTKRPLTITEWFEYEQMTGFTGDYRYDCRGLDINDRFMELMAFYFIFLVWFNQCCFFIIWSDRNKNVIK